MKFENLLELIKTVSDSTLTSFSYEENEVKIQFSKKETPVVRQEFQENVMDATPQEKKEVSLEGRLIKAPLVGTFYASPSEDAPAYVSVGDHITKGQILGIVEAMKLMNEIESDFDGVIEEILVENAEAVEYGQPLFRLK